jgi:predicted acyltransferase
MWPNDPEGLFTTLNASVTYFLGVVYMKIMRSVSKDYTKLFPLWLSFSSILFVSGMLLSTWIPLNKKIWSLSFVLTAGGCSGYALTFCLWLFDLSGLKFTKKL